MYFVQECLILFIHLSLFNFKLLQFLLLLRINGIFCVFSGKKVSV
jgi:hypothetical protein